MAFNPDFPPSMVPQDRPARAPAPTFPKVDALLARAAPLLAQVQAASSQHVRSTRDVATRLSDAVETVSTEFEARLAAGLAGDADDLVQVLREGAAFYAAKGIIATNIAAWAGRLSGPADGSAGRRQDQARVQDLRNQCGALSQEIGLEKVLLREQRHDATFAKDGELRSAIEQQERELSEAMTALRAARDGT